MGRNYPKNRKPRNTDYSMTQKLIKMFGEKELYRIWVMCNGMYKAADYLSDLTDWWVTPYVVRYLSNKFGWVRIVRDKELPVYKGYLAGKILEGYYKHIIFK